MMEKKFAHTYRIPSARLANWDYRNAAAYFVTICTQNREHHFGKVVNGRMNLSGMGVIADILWHEMTHHAKMVDLDAFVVMPNHIHGIVIIRGFAPAPPEQTLQDMVPEQTLQDMATVETLHATSLQSPAPSNAPQSPAPSNAPQSTAPPAKNPLMAHISPKPGSLAAIIRSYKSAVTRHGNRPGFPFAWQTRFHDHIIRNDGEFDRIRQYIINNPQQWENDKFYDQ